MNEKKNTRTCSSSLTVWGLLRQHVLGKKLIVIILCLAFTSGITFIRPLAVKGITDEGMLKADMRTIILFATFLLFCALIEQAVNVIQSRQFVVIQNSMMLSLYQAVFDKVLKLKKGYFTNHNSADIINRTTMDVRAVSMIADRGILFVISYVLAIIGGVLGLLLLNWKLAIVVIAVAPVKAIFSNQIAYLNEKATEESICLNRKFFSWFGDMISGLKEVKLWNLQSAKKEQLSKQQKDILKTSKKSVLYDSYNRAFMSLLDGMVQCILYIYGGSLLIQGEMTLGDITAFISYSSYVLGPITSLMSVRYMFSSIRPSLNRLNEFFALAENTIVSSKKMDHADLIVHNLEVRDLVFSHSQDDLLNGISFNVCKGERIAIIGQNGSGKSTLIDLLLRFEKPESGEILINGVNALKYPDAQYWNMFAAVEQEPYFFKDTVRNNVDPGGHYQEREIIKVFSISGILGFFQDRLQGDLNHMVHFDAGNLSGGERKKLAIARAILKDAPILIMDEAAADYDFESEQYLSKMIATQFQDKIIIYITHNYSYLNEFDRVYQIHKGKLIQLNKSEVQTLMKKANNSC